jgi:hypothetical protein
MVTNGKEPENTYNLLVAATFEKAITYVLPRVRFATQRTGFESPLLHQQVFCYQILTISASYLRFFQVANTWTRYAAGTLWALKTR